MRLLELHGNGSDGPVLEFHPNVTVVRGLSADAKDRVIRAISALPSADDPGMGGLVEAHGVVFDLSQESLGLLGLRTELDVLIRREDLPGASNGSEASPTAVASATRAEPPAGGSGQDPTAVLARLERTRFAYADASEALAVMTDALERAKLERAAVVEARQRVSTALEKVRRERDLARERMDEEPVADADEQELRDRIQELTEALDAATAAVSMLEESDPRPIEVLLEALRGPQSETLVPSQEALALADEFAVLQTRLDGLERELQASGLSMDQLSQALEDARFEVQQSEKAVERPNLGPDDVHELEDAHETVLEREKKAGGRIGRKAALARLEEARRTEQDILDRVGFPTWTAYIMGSSLLSIDPVAEQRLEVARGSLNEAEDAWEELTKQLEANPDYADLLDRLESVYLAAYDVLGGRTEGDLEDRLRSHMVPDEDVSHADIVDALVYQLGLRGVDVDEGTSEDVVTGTADSWLAEAVDHWEKHRVAKEEQERVESALAGAHQDLDVELSDVAEDSPEIRSRSYEEAESRVAEVLLDLESVQSIEDELEGQVRARELLIVPSRTAMEAATAALEEAEATAAAAGVDSAVSHEPPPTNDAEPAFPGDLPKASDGPGGATDAADGDSVEGYFLSRLAAQRGVSFAGSVPLVIDDALTGVDESDARSALAVLERLAGAVQLVYLTDDTSIAGWADSLGIERAATVDAPESSTA